MLFERVNSKNGLASAVYNLGTVYFAKKNRVVANKYLAQAEALAEELELRDLLKDIYGFQKNAYSQEKKYAQAFEYAEKLSVLKDSMLNENVENKLTNFKPFMKPRKKKKKLFC